jgi:hypothetical protein
LKLLGARHEVGLAVDLDQHADAAAVDVAADDLPSVAMRPARLAAFTPAASSAGLGGLGVVAVGLLERLLAVHHPGAGLLT